MLSAVMRGKLMPLKMRGDLKASTFAGVGAENSLGISVYAIEWLLLIW